MGIPPTIELSLPVQGMDCPACASKVEAALAGLPGVSHLVVDQTAGQARLVYDPARVDLLAVQQAVGDAGCEVPTEELTLSVRGMSCVACVAHVEGALTDLAGVLRAEVSLRKGTAWVQAVQGLVPADQMKAAVRAVGYEA